MFKNKRVSLLISIVFMTFGIILFSLAVQKYKVLIRSEADSKSVEIIMSPDETYGTSDQFFGVIVKDLTNINIVNELSLIYKNKNFQIQLIDPTADLIQSANFSRLSQEGFIWYLSFTDYAKMTTALNTYYEIYDNQITVELRTHDKFNKTRTENILTQYPKVRFHTSHFAFLPRNKIQEIIQQLVPPKLDAISLYTLVDNAQTPIFDNIKTMFATFYDASLDISGDSNIKINWPLNSKLSLSDIQTQDTSVKEQARRFGIISSAFVVYVQTKGKSDDASMKYITVGTYEELSPNEKKIVALYSQYIYHGYAMVWPWADRVNADPWYNTFYDKANTDPIMGIVGIKEGKYLGIMLNSRDMTATANLPDSIDFTEYKTFSNIRGLGNYINEDNQIVFEPYETIVFYTDNVAPPEAQGQLVCDAGADPYNSDTIVVTNNTSESINNLTSVTFRCTYIPDKVKKGFYKCETCTNSDEVNNPDCQVGVFDPSTSITDFSLAPGESKTISVTANQCEIIQFDIYNADDNVNDSPTECYNIRSQYINPTPPARWPGGIAFGINQNAQGYDSTTGTCPSNTPTHTPTPTQTTTTQTTTPADTPTDVPPTNTPTATPTRTPIATTILTSTPSPLPPPTHTLVPNPTPTPTPIKKLAVDEQPPGITPWSLILVPIGILILGLLL